MKRRIVKETCLFHLLRLDKPTMPMERFVVEVQDENGEWKTDLIPVAEGFQKNVPAIFGTENRALKYVNGEYGKIGREVIWEGENQ